MPTEREAAPASRFPVGDNVQAKIAVYFAMQSRYK